MSSPRITALANFRGPWPNVPLLSCGSCPTFGRRLLNYRDIPFPDAGHLGLPTCVFRHALLREQRRQVQALRAIHSLVRHLLPSTSTTMAVCKHSIIQRERLKNLLNDGQHIYVLGLVLG